MDAIFTALVYLRLPKCRFGKCGDRLEFSQCHIEQPEIGRGENFVPVTIFASLPNFYHRLPGTWLPNGVTSIAGVMPSNAVSFQNIPLVRRAIYIPN
jgi:hypothetical protein